MSRLNPFIALFRDPVTVLAALGYAVLLVAFTFATLTVIAVFLDRGWRHAVWLSEAWDFRHTSAQYGDEWEWYLPTTEVSSHVWRLGGYLTAIAFVVALDVWAIGAVVYVLS